LCNFYRKLNDCQLASNLANIQNAELAELVDAHVSGTCVERLGGSSPPFRINQ
jgi:hypothetical protein